MNWLMNLFTKDKEELHMSVEDTSPVVGDTSIVTASTQESTTVDVFTVDADLFSAQLKALLVTANGSAPTGYDELVKVALATVPTYIVTK